MARTVPDARDAKAASPASRPRVEWILFGTALAVYLVTRLAGITRFPIFFFCDEALQDNLARMLLDNHFRDQTGVLLPPYFLNDQRWAVSLSVYIHLIPVWIFGSSVACVRVTTALVSFAGVAGGGLALKEMRNRFWWSAPLLAGATPVFFVHARLGFETAMMASFFFLFLWGYFLYRTRHPRWIFAALAFGAATFYAYTAGQGVMLVMGLALLLSDLPYHVRTLRRHKAIVAGALLFAALLAWPYVRYRRLHPGVVEKQLVVLDSYWTHPIPLSAKLAQFGRNYAAGLDPRYWFRPNYAETERHRMDGKAFLPPVFAPLIGLGILACLWSFPRSALHRAVLLSPLGVPFSGAAASLQILRLMAIVVPATLLAAVGIDLVWRGLARLKVPWAPVGIAVGAVLVFENVRLTREALVDGPTWSKDYGLYGMQWGAPQVFGAIREEMRRDPKATFLLSSTWSNNPQEFIPFFLSPAERPQLRIRDIREWDQQEGPLSGTDVFVMTPEEWAIANNGKFVVEGPVRVIPYPDGRPGFRFARLRYSDEARSLFAKERAERAAPHEETATVRGEEWKVEHSRADMGNADALFDGRLETVLRGLEANPFVIDVRFPGAQRVREVGVSVGAMDEVTISVQVFGKSGDPKTAKRAIGNRPARDWIDVPLPGGGVEAERVRIEIAESTALRVSHIEVRELRFR